MFFLWVVGAGLIFASSWVGHAARRDEKRWLGLPLLALVAATALLATIGAVVMHDPEVTDGRYAAGVAWAVIGLGALPVLVFYSVGFFAPRTWILAVVWAVAIVPFGLYFFFGWIVVADYVNCPIDAHECPL